MGGVVKGSNHGNYDGMLYMADPDPISACCDHPA
jgi:hypothetical protein